MKKIIKKLFTPFAVFAMAIGIGVSLSAPKEVKGVKAAETAVISHSVTTSTNMTGGNDAALYGLADKPFSLVSDKAKASNHVGVNKDGTFRLYYGSGASKRGTILSVSLTDNSYHITGFTINYGSTVATAKIVVDGIEKINEVPTKNGVHSLSNLSATAFSIQNVHISNTQIYIKTISIDYELKSSPTDKQLVSITSAGTLVKKDYYVGDSFDPNGLTITAAFDDGSSADVTSLATFSPDPLTVGTTSVTASYSYGDVTKTTVISGITVQVKVSTVVISEVYGGGGNSGSLYRNDFVELYNNTDINIDISGWTVHYASAAGSFNNKTTLPDNSIILPYSYYLVKWAAGSSTEVPELPTADVEGSVFAGAKEFKVALTNNDTAPNSPTDTNVVDYVGAGNATAYEGAVAPGPSNSESISRTKSGNIYVDTDNNSADFTVGAPTPMNSALSIAEKIMETDTEMQCVTKFPEMKALVVQLSEGQLEYFQSTGDETLMLNARARYLAWAAYLGDNDAYGNGTGSSARSTTTNSSSNNVAAIALIGVIGITSLVGYYFINKKRLTA